MTAATFETVPANETAVLDKIASILAEPDWDADLIDDIANAIGTVRPHPGGYTTRASYARRFAEATGRTLPGDNDDEKLVALSTCRRCRTQITYDSDDRTWAKDLDRTYGCPATGGTDDHEPAHTTATVETLTPGTIWRDTDTGHWTEVGDDGDDGVALAPGTVLTVAAGVTRGYRPA